MVLCEKVASCPCSPVPCPATCRASSCFWAFQIEPQLPGAEDPEEAAWLPYAPGWFVNILVKKVT